MNSSHRVTDFSSLSVLSSVEQFIKAIDKMNETIMVPSRLLNVEIPAENEQIPALLRGACDPYSFYTILNSVKNSLLWGLSEGDGGATEELAKALPESATWFGDGTTQIPGTAAEGKASASAETTLKTNSNGHIRRTSSVSSSSAVSVASEQETERVSSATSDSGDSGVDAEDTELVGDVTSSLKIHLKGIQKCLLRLTETASFITEIYQEEVSAC